MSSMHDKLPNNLSELIEFMGDLPVIIESHETAVLDKYLELELKILNSLDIDQINFYIKTLTDKLNYSFESRTLVDDLTNIYSTNLIIERLLFILNRVLHLKLKDITKNDISKEMVDDLQKKYFMVSEFETELRKIFNYLLDKHIGASKNKEKNYLDQLNRLRNSLRVKYIGIDDDLLKNGTRDINIYLYSAFKEEYLDVLIKRVIDILLSISDEALDNEEIYAYAMSYQILLRSLFVILDDYHILASYEEYYMSKCNSTSVTKGIITSAFIANYHDLNEYSLSKTMD